MSAVVELSDVGLVCDGTRILDGLSWRVEPGQHWALLGANGSGKSSLTRILSGWTFPSSGQVEILGCRFGEGDVGEFRRHVGWVSPVVADALPAGLTARDVVLSGRLGTVGGYEDPSPDQEEAAAFFLDLLGLAPLAGRRFGILSQGERMKTLIARALAAQPTMLILDEPCAGLDPVARERFLCTLQAVLEHAEAPPLLLVTHHVEEIMPGISHVLALSGGRRVACGPKAEILAPDSLGRIFGCPFETETHGDRRWAWPRIH